MFTFAVKFLLNFIYIVQLIYILKNYICLLALKLCLDETHLPFTPLKQISVIKNFVFTCISTGGLFSIGRDLYHALIHYTNLIIELALEDILEDF